MKVDFLKSLGLDDDVIKQIQAESGKDVTNAKTSMQTQIDSLTEQVTELQGQVTKRDTDLTDLKTQLEQAGQSASKLAEVQKSFETLQSKYTQETTDYQKKLADQEYEFSAREAMNGIKFSCKSARKEFLNNLMAEKLPVKDGVLLGFEQFVAKQKEADPDAFVEEKKEDSSNGNPPPKFTNPNTPQSNQSNKDTEDLFGFNFIGVREKH